MYSLAAIKICKTIVLKLVGKSSIESPSNANAGVGLVMIPVIEEISWKMDFQ